MHNAFTANVKPGGLTSSTEIRILLCYLMHNVPSALSTKEIEHALLGEELVNYFELADSLSDLCKNNFAKFADGKYMLLPAGVDIAKTIGNDLPRSVRETAIRAALQGQQITRKNAEHKVLIEKTENGYNVNCWMEDCGNEVFRFSLFLPNEESANFVKAQFINHGDSVYGVLLAGLTKNEILLKSALDGLKG